MLLPHRLSKNITIRKLVVLIFYLLGGASGGSATALQRAPDECIVAAQFASDRTGVPLPILVAVTLTETGRRNKNGFLPWPWSINQAGKTHWFETQQEAVSFAEDQLDLGLQNFDVGCFQINHRWHSKGFRSTFDMFDPDRNALYAAEFLEKLYTENNDWSLAAAAYHSRTPAEAARYRTKFDAILAGLSDSPAPERVQEVAAKRTNRFPLLLAGRRGNSGSLVPLFSASERLIEGQP